MIYRTMDDETTLDLLKILCVTFQNILDGQREMCQQMAHIGSLLDSLENRDGDPGLQDELLRYLRQCGQRTDLSQEIQEAHTVLDQIQTFSTGRIYS